MFAVIETGGKQYKVTKGETLEIEKLEGKTGDTVKFDKVLLLGDASDTKIGTPVVSGAIVSGKIVEQKRGEKIVVFKMKPKKRYQKTQGHRQEITTVEIVEIKTGSTADKTEKATTTKKTTVKKPTAAKKKAPAANQS